MMNNNEKYQGPSPLIQTILEGAIGLSAGAFVGDVINNARGKMSIAVAATTSLAGMAGAAYLGHTIASRGENQYNNLLAERNHLLAENSVLKNINSSQPPPTGLKARDSEIQGATERTQEQGNAIS